MWRSGKTEIMTDKDPEDEIIYRVIVYQQAVYSVWPAERPARADWKETGKTGTHRQCIEFIKKVWNPALLIKHLHIELHQ